MDPRDEVFSYHHQFDDKPSSKSEDRKEYNIGVLRHLQVIFGHLAASRLQYYVPRGFWKQFRYWKPQTKKKPHVFGLFGSYRLSNLLPLSVSGYGASR